MRGCPWRPVSPERLLMAVLGTDRRFPCTQQTAGLVKPEKTVSSHLVGDRGDHHRRADANRANPGRAVGLPLEPQRTAAVSIRRSLLPQCCDRASAWHRR